MEQSQEAGSFRTEWSKGGLVVLCGLLGAFLQVSFIYSMGPIIAQFTAEFGWTRAEITLGASLYYITSALFQIPVGALADRYGPRRVALPGILVYCFNIVLLTMIGPSIWTWWLAAVLLGFTHSAISTTVWGCALPGRFETSFGKAIAVVQFGASLSLTFMPVISTYLVGEFGWRGAYVAIAGGGVLVLLPLTFLFFRDVPADTREMRLPKAKSELTFLQILQTREIQLLASGAALAMMGLLGLVVHFIPLLTDLGLAKQDAAWIAGVIGVGSIIGRLGCGFLLDYIKANVVGAVAFLMAGAACALLFSGVTSPALLAGCALVIGLTVGVEMDVIFFICGRTFSRRHYGAVVGALTTCTLTGGSIGPWVAGLFFNQFGNYHFFELLLAINFALAAFLIYRSTARAEPSAEATLPHSLAARPFSPSRREGQSCP